LALQEWLSWLPIRHLKPVKYGEWGIKKRIGLPKHSPIHRKISPVQVIPTILGVEGDEVRVEFFLGFETRKKSPIG
jgi:hypothetical protein